MELKFSNEILFIGGFIIIIVLFIQYMVYIRLKKQIKDEIIKLNGKKNNGQNKSNLSEKKKDNESIDIDTPESENEINIKPIFVRDISNDNIDNIDNNDMDEDSYVNPVYSEKNIDE